MNVLHKMNVMNGETRAPWNQLSHYENVQFIRAEICKIAANNTNTTRCPSSLIHNIHPSSLISNPQSFSDSKL